MTTWGRTVIVVSYFLCVLLFAVSGSEAFSGVLSIGRNSPTTATTTVTVMAYYRSKNGNHHDEDRRLAGTATLLPLRMVGGWDNDDFLSSLGRGNLPMDDDDNDFESAEPWPDFGDISATGDVTTARTTRLWDYDPTPPPQQVQQQMYQPPPPAGPSNYNTGTSHPSYSTYAAYQQQQQAQQQVQQQQRVAGQPVAAQAYYGMDPYLQQQQSPPAASDYDDEQSHLTPQSSMDAYARQLQLYQASQSPPPMATKQQGQQQQPPQPPMFDINGRPLPIAEQVPPVPQAGSSTGQPLYQPQQPVPQQYQQYPPYPQYPQSTQYQQPYQPPPPQSNPYAGQPQYPQQLQQPLTQQYLPYPQSTQYQPLYQQQEQQQYQPPLPQYQQALPPPQYQQFPQYQQYPQYPSQPQPPPAAQQQQQQKPLMNQLQVPPSIQMATSADSREDELPSGDIPGAVPLSKDTIEAIKRSNDSPQEEASQGGQLFRSLMARAATTVKATIPTTINPMDLSIEEQARLFRELMAQQQQQQQQVQQQQRRTPPTNPETGLPLTPQQQLTLRTQKYDPTQTNFLGRGIGSDGRKIGRNKDAEMISTNADAYMAKLKRDSSTRNLARYEGDTIKANTIFHDPTIQDIEAPVNPYLEEQRRKERDMYETVPEEMLLFQEYGNDQPQASSSSSSLSYKDKLAQARAKKQNPS